MTDNVETSIAGIVEAVILRRAAAVQRQTANDSTSWAPWAILGRLALRVTADINDTFARHLDQGTSLAAIAHARNLQLCPHCDARALTGSDSR